MNIPAQPHCTHPVVREGVCLSCGAIVLPDAAAEAASVFGPGEKRDRLAAQLRDGARE